MAGQITAVAALCSAGNGVEQIWASIRAGLSAIGNSGILDRRGEPIRMGLVPQAALQADLPAQIASVPLPARARRMLRLGAPALRTVLAQAGPPPLRLFLGLPQLTLEQAPWLRSFALYLATMAGTTLDLANSRIVPAGRAAALLALELALEALAEEPERPVIVGGVDTYLDLSVLAALDADRRLLGSTVSDGFIPGEGAAFLVLSQPKASRDGAAVSIEAAASARDPGHRAGTVPARGEGLAMAIEQLRTRLPDQRAIIGATFAGLTGESFDAKQWGVARIRHADFFAEEAPMSHPADCFADPGAALGALLLAICARAIARGDRPDPALVWAASDGETRACALLSRSRT